jgi:hypothetical protein
MPEHSQATADNQQEAREHDENATATAAHPRATGSGRIEVAATTEQRPAWSNTHHVISQS